ncbi:DUF2147 domain-containing protein [Muriicola soli]|uniref:DUF2147 domain-containing protein n=2 Tax=Muriicola soli TaxID=2507538 RepID=A0A411EDC0_9FLAO|nr:DUF2147 domain-containing protein [Muriicola soli]
MLMDLSAQSVLGLWKTIDDVTEKPKSILEIYEKDGELFAKVVEILVDGREDALCVKCKGPKKDQPIEGMIVFSGLQKIGENEYGDGTILDPESGKEYRCKIFINPENPNQLKVRGYVAFFFRTQIWRRVSS